MPERARSLASSVGQARAPYRAEPGPGVDADSAQPPGRRPRRGDAAARVTAGMLFGPQWVAFALLVVLLLAALYPLLAHAQPPIASTRVWPSKEYTRVTIESASQIRYAVFSVPAPDRIVLDLEGVESSPHLDALPGKISADDPYVK